ncbi:hypothetical protein Q1695_009446 [Nippostrongylus brasiliensis]|nr:hypothetical protein Q1695_009446 [Nippostrongylus brasiliensis]
MRGKYKTICDVDRQRIIDAYLSGQSALMISRIVGTKRTTIDSIIKIFIKDGRVKTKKRGGEKRATKLSEEQKHLIKTWIDDDCSITLRKMKQKYLSTFGIDVSMSTINRLLGSFSYTVKRTHLQPLRRNDADSIEARFEFAQSFLQICDGRGL